MIEAPLTIGSRVFFPETARPNQFCVFGGRVITILDCDWVLRRTRHWNPGSCACATRRFQSLSAERSSKQAHVCRGRVFRSSSTPGRPRKAFCREAEPLAHEPAGTTASSGENERAPNFIHEPNRAYFRRKSPQSFAKDCALGRRRQRSAAGTSVSQPRARFSPSIDRFFFFQIVAPRRAMTCLDGIAQRGASARR